jgi:hypothetical protein
MQLLNRHIMSNTTSGSITGSLALPFSNSLDAVLPTGQDLHFMSLMTAHEFLSYTPDQTQLTPHEELAFIADVFSTDEKFISLTGLMIRDASDTISFFADSHPGYYDNMYFSINVPVELAPADCALIIDTERAVSFRITVFGMLFPINGGLQIVNSMLRCSLRQRRESMGTGRMICLLNQQLNL